MHLRKLVLDNVKCFAKGTTVDFMAGKSADERPHRWVVVYGSNGLGKSTLLKSIAIALTGHPAVNHLLPSAEGWVRGSSKAARIEIEFTRNVDERRGRDVISGQRKKPLRLAWILTGKATTINTRPYPAGSLLLDEEYRDASLFRSYIATDESEKGWLLCGYGAHRRLTGASSDIAEKTGSTGRAARSITLFHEKAALTSAERWLIELDHDAKKRNNPDRLETIKRIINDGLLHGGVSLAEIQTDRVLFKTPFSDAVPMADLSDGYRTSLSLVIDLLRHISHCFDLNAVTDLSGSRPVVNAEGVVLIDELDSHLHPEWQRTIGPWLHRSFPELQFVVATHSPLVPERVSADDGMVVRLRRRTQGKGEVVVAECVRTTDKSLTADQNLTGPNFGLHSTRDVMIDTLLEKIRSLDTKVRRQTATEDERRELLNAQTAFEFEAPVVGMPIESESQQ